MNSKTKEKSRFDWDFEYLGAFQELEEQLLVDTQFSKHFELLVGEARWDELVLYRYHELSGKRIFIDTDADDLDEDWRQKRADFGSRISGMIKGEDAPAPADSVSLWARYSQIWEDVELLVGPSSSWLESVRRTARDW